MIVYNIYWTFTIYQALFDILSIIKIFSVISRSQIYIIPILKMKKSD